MTETAVVVIVGALIAAGPPTVLAWLAWKQSQENSKKSDAITGKVNEVHSLANSNLSAQTAALAEANTKIAILEKSVGALVERLSVK